MSQALMQAAVCTGYGAAEMVEIKLVPKPIPKPDEVLIRVMASTVNSGDVRMRGLKVKGPMKLIMRLVLGWRKPRKAVLGVAFAGVVEAVGESVSKFEMGAKVFGLTGFRFGAHAEYLVLKASATMIEMPANASFEEAAALPFGAHTAIHFLQSAGIATKKNCSVLIYGATGAVGVSAIQMALHYQAKVTAVCSSRGESIMRQFALENVLCYDQSNFTQTSEKFDIIFDAVGKISRKQCRHLLQKEGRFITVGGLAVAQEKTEQLELVKYLFENGNYLPVIDRIFPLKEIVAAHSYVDSERKKGNVVLQMEQGV